VKAAIIAAVLLCAGLIGLTVYLSTKPDTSPRTTPIDPSYTTRSSSGSWTMGATTPKVTLVEYGDFQCPGCGAMYPVIKQAVDQTKDFVQFQFRDYPLVTIHNKALVAARAAEAAGRQGKFWEMHDLLYSNQTAWENDTTFAFPGTLDQYATQLNLDVKQFDRDLDDSTINKPIDDNIAAGNAINIQGTPTMIINGKEVSEYMTTKYGSTDDYKANPSQYTLPRSVDDLVGFLNDAANGK
jgi:protein-disulfide isomerase